MPVTRKKSRRSSALLKQAARRTVSRLNRSEELKKSRTRMSSEKRKKELDVRALENFAKMEFEINLGVANTYTDKAKREEALKEANEKYQKKREYITRRMEDKLSTRARGKRTRKKKKRV